MKKAFCSWSGGKDSCLALSRAKAAGVEITHLVTMFDESGIRSRSHAVSLSLMRAQADALGLEFVAPVASWQSYEAVFIETMKTLQREAGCEVGIFGDIDLEPHREWEEKVCAQAGFEPLLPLWGENRLLMVNEFLDEGYEAVVICVNEKYLGREFCGRNFDRQFLADLPAGVDACGENGEFHTFVTNGKKLFSNKVPCRAAEIYHHAPAFPSGETGSFYYARLEIV